MKIKKKKFESPINLSSKQDFEKENISTTGKLESGKAKERERKVISPPVKYSCNIIRNVVLATFYLFV